MDGTTYNVAVSGMTISGSVIASVDVGVAQDAATNPNDASTSTDNTVAYDITAPTVTIDQAIGQADPTNSGTINFTVVFNEAVAGFGTSDVSLTGTAGAITGTVTEVAPMDGTTYNVAVSDMSGSGTVIASVGAGVAEDTATNPNGASTSTDDTVTYDINAPNSTIDPPLPANPTAITSASFSFSGDDGSGSGVAGFECSLDGGFSTCTSPQNYDSLGDGSHTFQVRAIDDAGNIDPTPATYTWVVDATAPNTTITSIPGNPTTSTDAHIIFNGDDGTGTGVASFECALDGGFSACTSPQDFSSLSNGSHTFRVRAIDNVGNTDATPASFTWVVDTIAPDTSIIGGPTNPTNGTVASFTFGGNDGTGTGVASFECALDGGFSACTSPQAYSSLTPGSHTFQVRAIDVVGNTDATPASFTWVVDTTAPTAVITSTALDPTNTSPIPVTITFSEPVYGFGSLVAADDLAISNGTASDLISGSDGDTVYTFAITPVGQGTVSVYLQTGRVHDLAGNNNSEVSNTLSRNYNSIKPTVTIEQGGSQTDPTNFSPINFTVVFSEPVNNFGTGDVDLSASTTLGTLSGIVSEVAPMDGTTYDVSVSGMSSTGAVIAAVPADAAWDTAANGNDASTSVDHSVAYTAAAPVITEGASISITMSKNGTPIPFALTLHATDANLDPLTWSILTPADFGTADVGASTGIVSYTPSLNYTGLDSFTVQVSDGYGGTDSITVNVTIQAPAVITSPNKVTFTVGHVESFTITTTGFPTGASMLISAVGPLPDFVTFTDNHDGTATLAGVPMDGTTGTYLITITAANGVGSVAVQTFSLKVWEKPIWEIYLPLLIR